jgi:hypothetical protein
MFACIYAENTYIPEVLILFLTYNTMVMPHVNFDSSVYFEVKYFLLEISVETFFGVWFIWKLN